MELRDLQTFVAVAEAGALRRAAQHLGLDGSAVSGRVGMLEDELGVRLTGAGRRFLTDIRLVMSHLDGLPSYSDGGKDRQSLPFADAIETMTYDRSARCIAAGRTMTAPMASSAGRADGERNVWSMDFVSDALCDGRRLRALTVVDAFTREALAIDVDQGIKGEQMVAAMARITSSRGAPKTIRVDNGPVFSSKALDRWAYENDVTLDFSRPGKPTDSAFVESFNGRLRDACLNAHWFLSLARCPSQDRGLAAGL